MLKVLRKRKRSWLIVLALGAIIIVFVFWGIGNFRVDKRTIAARVNGKPITTIEYTKAYQRQINYYRNTFKDQFSDELIEKMNLKQNTINMLINMELGLQEAKKRGIAVSTEDVQKAIQAVPGFQRDGVFDKGLYLQVLKANHVLPGEYEKSIEDSLIIEKLQKKATETINIPDKDIEDAFNSENKKVNLEYLAVDGVKFEKTVSATDEEAKAYFEKNKATFKVSAMVKAVYVSIMLKDIAQRVKVSEAEIKGYYEKNVSEFQKNKEVSARHILIKPTAGADIKRAKEEAKKKAEEILTLAKKGEDFAGLAKKYSEDPVSAKQGGSLGYFGKGVMVKPFEDAAFSLKKGEVSGIVETEFGYHIIKVDDIKEARLIPLKEAKDTITKKLAQIGAKKLALEIGFDIHKAATAGKKNLKAEALKKKVKATETGFFSEKDFAVELVRNQELKNAAFSMKPGEISNLIETESGVYIINLLDRKEEHIPTYEDAAGNVKTAVAKEKAREKAKEAADAVLKRLKQGEDLKKLASKEGYTIGESGYISKVQGYISSIGLYAGDKPEVFSLSKENPYYSQTVPQGNKFYILKLKEGKEADKGEFEAKKNEIRNRLLQQRQEEALSKSLNDLKSKAKIEINHEAL
ncbi:MAG: SurA N-terminal domain-containing protein [Deltaproteobacteria bacterium]|nr:SurA N-terminal domain-containing protein [Deltaproteobacteria bacterium]